MDSRGTMTLGGVVAGTFERRVVVLVSVLLGLAGGFFLSTQAPVSYSSTSYVQVYPVGRPPDMNTEQIFASSGPVAARAAQSLADGTTASELSAATSVGNPQNSQILTFQTRLPAAQQAADAANAFSKAYLEERKQQLVAAGNPDSANPGIIVDAAEAAAEPSGTSAVAYIAAGGVLGLLFGLLLALMLDRFDPQVRTARRMQGLFYDQIFVSSKDSAETTTALTVLTDRLAREHASTTPSIALLGSNPALVEKTVPVFSKQTLPSRDSSSLAVRTAPKIVNAAAMGSPAHQIAAAANSDLIVLLATPKDNRAKVQELADQAAMITGRPCVGWYVKA